MRSAPSTSSGKARASARSASRSGSPPSASTASSIPPAFPGSTTTTTRRTSSTSSTAAPRRSRSSGEERILGPGGLFHVESTTPRRIANVGDDELVLLVIGGKDGYVERDGHVVSDEDLALRQSLGKGAAVKGLMMDFQLTLPTILKRAETYFPHQEIVTRMPDRSFHRYTFADFGSARAGSRSRSRISASSPATASRRSAGTTTSTSRRTSGSRAAASSCTRSTCACTRTTSATSPRTRATRP